MPKTMLRARDLGILATALVTIGGISGITHSAAAGYPVSLTVEGPSVLTATSNFSIDLDDKSALDDQDTSGTVCRVQETSTRQSDTSAPFDLPVTLSSLPAGTQTLTFQAVACDNTLLGQERVELEVPVHVVSASAFVAPGAQDASLRKFKLAVSSSSSGLSAVIKRGSTVVDELGPSSSSSATWTWVPGSAPAGSYRAEVTSGGSTVSVPFTVTAGWAPLSPAFRSCQTLTWSYSARNEPARAAGMASDISTAFARVASATGIKFRKVPSKGAIQLSWADLGTSGPDGEGGATWSGDTAVSGKVQFNVRSSWVGKKGFTRDHGFPGRGALITHEIGHALGLGHVTDRKQVMYPIASTGSPTGLAKGDKAGLNALYNTKSC